MSIIEPLALKYRPKKLSEVIGQPVVVKAFYNAFKSNTLHHAYILAGNMGCGKTTVARIIAAMENCKKNGKDPCGVCSNCKDIFSGNSYEVLEIDAGSRGKVDDIRDLQKTLYQNPVECRTRYVILDEAHSLTGAAAEASLKMIEEPPKNVRFVLCTTEPQAFKPTIHSRCISWKFNKVGWQEIFGHLKSVAEQEKIVCDDKSLQIMARYSKGSVRNSLQYLQTAVNFVGDNNITYKDTIDSIGVVDDFLFYSLIDNIIDQNAAKCFQIINKLFMGGKEAQIIINGVYSHLNNLLINRTCPESIDDMDITEEDVKMLSHQNSKMPSGNIIIEMMNLISGISFDTEYNINPVQSFNKFSVSSIQMVRAIKVKSSKS